VDTKGTVRTLLSQLPENCTFEDAQYHLYVTQATERGSLMCNREIRSHTNRSSESSARSGYATPTRRADTGSI
jgi:hypothetical protein